MLSEAFLTADMNIVFFLPCIRIMSLFPSFSVGLPAGASPPVFEQIFRNARFAQGGDAMFEGKVQGNPKPTVTWTRKGAQIVSGNKYQVRCAAHGSGRLPGRNLNAIKREVRIVFSEE